MSEHTKGPWNIITPDMLRTADVLALDLDPSAIIIGNLNADTPAASVVADIWTVGDDESEQQANARLIAAAPELLDALKLIESVYRQNCVSEGEPSSVLDAVQAAIAKAEGRA
jgi:hypothetical protein